MSISYDSKAVSQIRESITPEHNEAVHQTAKSLMEQGLSKEGVGLYFSRRYGMPKAFGKSFCS